MLAAFLAITILIQPTYGAADIQGLAIGALPLAMAAVAQAIVVISGGIDLSVGPMMALTSVTAAVLMQGQSEVTAVGVVVAIIVLGLLIGAINGVLVVITRVPDIVVTLAMSFVWAGATLLVLNTPGGGSAEWLKGLMRGSIGSDWVPQALVVLVVVVAAVWIPLRRSRTGPRAVRGRKQPSFRIQERRRHRPDEGHRVCPDRTLRGVRRAGADRRRPASGHRSRETTRCSALPRSSSVA